MDTIIRMIQHWLDWQENKYAEENIVVDDNTMFYTVPVWPSRGMFKAWIACLTERETTLERYRKALERIAKQIEYTDDIIDGRPTDGALIAREALEGK